MARALGEGTGAARADVWVRVGEALRPEAVWPVDAETISLRHAPSEDEQGTVTASTMFEPVRHHGELLGALSIEKRPGESMTTTEEKLVRDLAAQAGLVLRNVGLTEDLRATIEQLRASRQRLVSAQDEERRRLERNLHDGAQQQLVALSVKLRLLEQLVERDPAQARSVAAQLQGDTTEALEELRDLALGDLPAPARRQGAGRRTASAGKEGIRADGRPGATASTAAAATASITTSAARPSSSSAGRVLQRQCCGVTVDYQTCTAGVGQHRHPAGSPARDLVHAGRPRIVRQPARVAYAIGHNIGADEGSDPEWRQGHAPPPDYLHQCQAARAGREQAGALLRSRGAGRTPASATSASSSATRRPRFAPRSATDRAWGARVTYIEQDAPRGLAHAVLISESFSATTRS